LNQARSHAAACCLKDQVYIFAGYDGINWLNSIEKIGAGSLISNGRDRWELIQTSPTILSPRWFPAVAPLNNTEIMIFGGDNGNNKLGDVIVFDT
jgi:N-acetylneuraminic acid mutarotase